ncbi:MAG TPA: glycosyltransferase family 39 protein [Nevskiales bacterium]|nr:glycosyltransferase family 39 protein [Nevskiales bacterium]
MTPKSPATPFSTQPAAFAPIAGLGLASPGWWRRLLLLVLALAALSTARGVVQAPVDVHEAYVLETAQQMLERDDWIVPYFNERPRLNKPPLNYWLTAALARASGQSHVRPWHGRLPSALAGVGLVLLALLLGARLFGRETGLLAGLMLATSNGYISHAADARPEMLYAFLCTLGLTGFITAQQLPDRSAHQAWLVRGMWLAYALAILAKGPQIPGMFLVAGAVYCAIQRMDGGRALRCFRPLTGLLTLGLIALPWWIALQRLLPPGTLENSQLGGTLLTERWAREPNPYYLYHPTVKLFMPWTLLLPALPALRRLPQEARAHALQLGIVYLTMVALFSFNDHYRSHYLLPGLMPGCLLLASAMVGGLHQMRPAGALFVGRLLLASAGTAAVAGLGYGLYRSVAGTHGMPPELVPAFAAMLGLWLAAARASREASLTPVAHVLASALMLGFALVGLGGTRSQLQQERDTSVELAAAVERARVGGAPVAAWRCSPELFVYLLRQPIMPLTRLDELDAALAGSPAGQLVLIAPTRSLAGLPAHLQADLLYRDAASGGRAVALLRYRMMPDR